MIQEVRNHVSTRTIIISYLQCVAASSVVHFFAVFCSVFHFVAVMARMILESL